VKKWIGAKEEGRARGRTHRSPLTRESRWPRQLTRNGMKTIRARRDERRGRWTQIRMEWLPLTWLPTGEGTRTASASSDDEGKAKEHTLACRAPTSARQYVAAARPPALLCHRRADGVFASTCLTARSRCVCSGEAPCWTLEHGGFFLPRRWDLRCCLSFYVPLAFYSNVRRGNGRPYPPLL
jgi:hypothetical protein